MSEIRLPADLQHELQQAADALSLSLSEYIAVSFQTARFWQQHLEEVAPQFTTRLNVAMARHEALIAEAEALT